MLPSLFFCDSRSMRDSPGAPGRPTRPLATLHGTSAPSSFSSRPQCQRQDSYHTAGELKREEKEVRSSGSEEEVPMHACTSAFHPPPNNAQPCCSTALRFRPPRADPCREAAAHTFHWPSAPATCPQLARTDHLEPRPLFAGVVSHPLISLSSSPRPQTPPSRAALTIKSGPRPPHHFQSSTHTHTHTSTHATRRHGQRPDAAVQRPPGAPAPLSPAAALAPRQ